MTDELIRPLAQAANPAVPGVAIEQSTSAVEGYMDQLEATGQGSALDALTKVVLDRAKSRGQHYVQEPTQHDG